MAGNKVWINEKEQVLKNEVFGSIIITLSHWYDQYRIVATMETEQDPMDNEWNWSSIKKETLVEEWIESESVAFQKYDNFANLYRSLSENAPTKRMVIGNTYIELWFNNIKHYITIGDVSNIQNQHTLYETTSDSDATKRFVDLVHAHYKILG